MSDPRSILLLVGHHGREHVSDDATGRNHDLVLGYNPDTGVAQVLKNRQGLRDIPVDIGIGTTGVITSSAKAPRRKVWWLWPLVMFVLGCFGVWRGLDLMPDSVRGMLDFLVGAALIMFALRRWDART